MSIGRLSEFNLSGGSWSTYVERLEQYFIVNGVESDRKVPTLIACVGDATYELMVDLCSPKKPKEVPYDELVEIVKKHIQPIPSILAERYKFRKRVQSQNESVAQFSAALKHLARTCEFKNNLQENLRDQFACGLYDEPTRQRLFCETDPPFQKAYEIALSLEAAAKDAAAVEQQHKSMEGSVHLVQASYGSGGRGGGARRRQFGGRNSAAPAAPAAAAGARGGLPAHAQYGRQTYNNNNRCNCCGASDHAKEKCKFIKYVCRVCLREGHLQRMCPNIKKDWNDRQVLRLEADEEPYRSEEAAEGPYGDGGAEGLYMVELRGSEPVIADVEVAGRRLRMHVDTGSPISCINYDTYRELYGQFELCTERRFNLKGYDGRRIVCLGFINVRVSFGEVTKMLQLYVIQNGGVPLLGREWIKDLGMDVIVVNSLISVRGNNNDKQNECVSSFNKSDFVQKYPNVFSGKLGKLRSEKASLHLKAGATPVYRRARPLPLALRPRVDAELERMTQAGIISPITSSDWASCLVVVLKSNGALRICGDYKSTVNPVLDLDRHPLPRSEVLFNNLSGGKRFTKIDLSEAYSQIELDSSKYLTVVNTHRGLYVYNRLVYGLASAPSIFQRIMERIVAGIPNVSVFLDDILITGVTEADHMRNLHAVFKRLSDEGLTIREEKCSFFEKEVRYLGFIISEQGIRTDETKVEAVVQAPEPTNVSELKSFLGMINFYSKFIDGFSRILYPLYNLLKSDTKWEWTAEHRSAFQSIKKSLTTCPVLMHYDESLPLILTCDASGRGVGAVLTQRTERGERPVCYASRTLSQAEANYSQIQREALAIVFGVKKFHSYLYGRKFILRTDHQPLTTIFGSKKDLPHTASGRLIRWAILLSGYQYDIEYVRSSLNRADALSRLPIPGTDEAGDEAFINFIEDNFPIDIHDVRLETSKDSCLSRALDYVRGGWPKEFGSKRGVEGELAILWRRREELCAEGGCLLRGNRVVVPAALRERVLAELHGAHLGIVKCKGLARSYVWWPGLDGDIEKTVASCQTCARTADLPPKVPITPWSWPSRPFERVHVDFFYFKDVTYLLVIDGHSKWIEIVPMPTTTASVTILKLKEIFARFGLPKKLVSDNGPPFRSDEFLQFLKKNGIKHITSAPYHPPSNGEAENAVRTIKKALSKANFEKISPEIFIQRFLLDYRNSVHCTTGETPARLMLGRQLRTRLDLLKGDVVENVRDRIERKLETDEGALRNWEEGDQVWAKDYRKDRKWEKAYIIKKRGSSLYEVKTEEGLLWSRHANQLRSRLAVPAAAAPAAGPARQAPAVSRSAISWPHTDQPPMQGQMPPEQGPRRVRRPVLRYGIDY